MPKIKTTRLTDYEVAVLTLLAQGYNGPEVGEAMGISKVAVASAYVRIRNKLEARTTIHAVVIAIKQGLI